MPETRVLFRDIDAPGLATIDGYREHGGYGALERSFRELDPEDLIFEIEESGCAARRRRLLDGQERLIPASRRDEKYSVATRTSPNRERSRIASDGQEPPSADRGLRDRGARGRRHARLHLHPRRVLGDRRHPRPRRRRGLSGGPSGSTSSARGSGSSSLVHRGAGAYICGEETALLDALEGKRGNPRLKPPFPAIQGLYDGPTLINNVETLSNVPHIVNNGAAWFKGFGPSSRRAPRWSRSPAASGGLGTTRSSSGSRREIIFDLAGGPGDGRRVKAWFPGGSSAPVLTEAELDLLYTFEDLAGAGSMLGSGSIIVADDTVSIPELALRTARFYHHESCGKCTPCREGPTGRRRCSSGWFAARRRRSTLRSSPRCRRTSSGTACACSATRWRCRLARWWPSSGPSSTSTSTTFRRLLLASGGGRVSGGNGGRRLMAERPQITIVVDGVEVRPRGRDARRCRQGR